MTPGRLFYLARRDMARGWRAAYHDYFTAPKIRQYRCLDLPLHPSGVPIHLLTGANDWHLALWMLASFFHFTRHRWPVVVHGDGTLTTEAASAFQQAIPDIQCLARVDADLRMAAVLADYPLCREYRQTHPLALKIFDIPALTTHDRFMILDSDVLFFSRPDEILDWVESRRDECLFIRDVAEASTVSVEEAEARLGVKLWPQVNSGVCLVPRAAVPLPFCEQCLAQTSVRNGHIWRIEQTLFALCASRYGRGGLLPRSYEVVLTPRGSITSTARHYVGAVRQAFYAEGLARLHRLLV